MQLFKRIRVKIVRAPEVHTITDVFEHEMPILIREYGQGNVIPLLELEPGEFEDGVFGEYARLERKFRRPDADASPLRAVYPSAEALAQTLGVEFRRPAGYIPDIEQSVHYDGRIEDGRQKRARAKKDADVSDVMIG